MSDLILKEFDRLQCKPLNYMQIINSVHMNIAHITLYKESHDKL